MSGWNFFFIFYASFCLRELKLLMRFQKLQKIIPKNSASWVPREKMRRSLQFRMKFNIWISFKNASEKWPSKAGDYFTKDLFTWEFSSWDDFPPGRNSTRYLVVFLLLFTRFCPSQDDFIPVLSTAMKCHPSMKQSEKCHVSGLSGMKVPYMNCVFEGMGEMNSTLARRRLSREPRMKTFNHVNKNFIIPGQTHLGSHVNGP